MKVDISGIVRINGASLDIEQSGFIDGSDGLVNLKGRIVNSSGILKLEGRLDTVYTATCCRCNKDISRSIKMEITEDFIENGKNAGNDVYTYEGGTILIDKVLLDNIILNLPMKQLCSKACKGLCAKCGADLNETVCGCRLDTEDSRMEALKDFFNN